MGVLFATVIIFTLFAALAAGFKMADVDVDKLFKLN